MYCITTVLFEDLMTCMSMSVNEVRAYT